MSCTDYPPLLKYLTMHDAALAVFTPLACVLVLLPVPIHIRARNYATIFNVCWLFIMNLCTFINIVHFWNRSKNDIPVFCDICKSFEMAEAETQPLRSSLVLERLWLPAVFASIAGSQPLQPLARSQALKSDRGNLSP
jgi:hypothetical protein